MNRTIARPSVSPAHTGSATLAASLRGAGRRPLLAHVRETVTRRSLPLLAALGFALVAGSPFAAPPCASSPAPAPAPVAEFTGRFAGGAPVYRLPAITVSAERSVAAAASSVRKDDPRLARRG